MTDEKPADKKERYFTNSEIDQYHLWLGRLVSKFAEVESLLRVQCAALSGMNVEFAGIVFGDLSVSAAVDVLKRLRKALDLPDDRGLVRALVQLQTISTTRNAILHRGVQLTEEGFFSGRGLPNSRLPSRAIDPDLLADMYGDLNTISAALALANPIDDPQIKSWEEGVRKASLAPWRYTIGR